jgi:amidase
MEISVESLDRASIAEIKGAVLTGRVSAVELVNHYRVRAESLESSHSINAVVTRNDRADQEAARLDALAKLGHAVGPLHGVPVVVKDNLETADMPTSFGSEVFRDYVPYNDATVVEKLRAAGAIIMAKTTMPDWASAWFSQSSRSGATKNPYDLSREPGGSSAGTASAVAAGYAAVGLGTDTGGSVRLPASFCNLVGIRSTPGVISRNGCSPLISLQDTIGPLARSVGDAVRVFDVIAGYDQRDSMTVSTPGQYLSSLQVDGLEGKRLGVLQSAFAADSTDTAPVNSVMRDAIAQCAAGGATVVDVEVNDLESWIASTTLYALTSRSDMNAWMSTLKGAPMNSVDEIVESGRYDPKLTLLESIATGPLKPSELPEYLAALAARYEFMMAVLNAMDRARVDALIYPTCQAVPPYPDDTHLEKWGTTRYLTPLVISSQTWLPAMSVPAGFTREGHPVGMEILARPYAERLLFAIGYGFEQIVSHRRLPSFAR